MVESKKGLNILILHAHWNNRGDESAIRAMIDSLRASLPVDKMSIMMFPRDSPEFPYDDIQVLKPYPDGKRQLADTGVTLLTFGGLSLTRSGRRFLHAVREADVVIHAPGGPVIGDIYRGKYLNRAYIYRLFMAGFLFKKPVYFYAPSMGPFTSELDNFFRKFVLKSARAIVLREEISSGYLENQLGIRSTVTCDSALQNTIPPDYIDRYDNLGPVLEAVSRQRMVGITVTDLKWHPVHGKNGPLRERIMRSMSGLIESLMAKGYEALLIPQGFGGNSDVPLLESLRRPGEGRVMVLPGSIDAYGQQVVISKLHSVVCMRYHSGIFSAKGRVPFVCVCYEHKIRGFMDKLGLSELIVELEDISAEKLIERFEHIERNRESIKKTLDERIPELQRLSARTTELVAESIPKAVRPD